jgi:hypothetical protein
MARAKQYLFGVRGDKYYLLDKKFTDAVMDAFLENVAKV